MPATCCRRPRSAACSSPASTPAGGSRCTAWCARCCWPSSSVALPTDCASSTRARPGGWRAWATTWRRSSTGWTPASPREALRLLAAISMSRLDAGATPTPSSGSSNGSRPRSPARTPTRWLQYAWCHLLVDRADFLDAVGGGRGRAHRRGTPERDGSRWASCRSTSAWLAGDWQSLHRPAHGGLELLGDAAPVDPIGRFGWSLAIHGVALDERWSDERPVVAAGRTAVVNDTRRGLAHEGARAVGLALAGQPARLAAHRRRRPAVGGVRRDADAAHRARLRRGDRRPRAR